MLANIQLELVYGIRYDHYFVICEHDRGFDLLLPVMVCGPDLGRNKCRLDNHPTNGTSAHRNRRSAGSDSEGTSLYFLKSKSKGEMKYIQACKIDVSPLK